MTITNDILTLAAIVAALVGVFKMMGLNTKYSPLAALGVAAIFVLIPESWQAQLIMICVIGLSAAGVYHYSQNSNITASAQQSTRPNPIVNNSGTTTTGAGQATVIFSADGKQKISRTYTHRHDTHDHRDLLFVPTIKKLPRSIDLRHFMPPVFDQGQLGSCTANGILGLFGYYMIASGKEYKELSRLFLYWQERNIEGTVNQDAGAMIRDGLKALQTIGCCPESDFPYDISRFTQTPSAKAEQDAAANRIYSYHRVMKLSTLKAALAQKQPVVFGFTVYESFESWDVSCGGVVPMPDTSKEKMLGGHCVLAVGYDDVKQQVIVRNSWGTDWGDHGYCYMPYAMFENGIVTDMWVGKLNAPKLVGDVSFMDAINHYAAEGVIDNPPTTWIEYDTKTKAGTLTLEDAKYVELLVQKLAARDETLTEL